MWDWGKIGYYHIIVVLMKNLVLFQEKLEKSVKKIQQDEDAMDKFVTKVNKWLSRHLSALFLLFDTFDSNETGFLSYRQFKTGKYHQVLYKLQN